MANSKYPLFMLALFLLSVMAWTQPSLSKELTKIEELQPPPWPLAPLNRFEREARLKFVLDTQKYQVAKADAPLSEEDCVGLLKQLNNSEAVHILDPDIVAQSRVDAKVPDNLIAKCSTVEFDRVWFSYDKGVLSAGADAAFDALPLDQKDAKADFYHKKTGPIEFYDVSRFFGGKKTWGTFAEGGEFICNVDRKICSELQGYRLNSDLVVGPVVDAESCTPHLPSKVKSGGRMIENTAHPYAFRELPNFYAYAEIDEDLYRLGLSGPIPWGDFHRLLHEGGTTLIAEPANTKKGGYCMYETKPNKEGK